MKYRLCFTGTFNNISSIYTNAYNLKIKCQCGKEHEKRVTLCHQMIPPKHLTKKSSEDLKPETGVSTRAMADSGDNKKLNHKISKEHFNMIVTCRECKTDMRIKIRDMERKGDVLEKISNKKASSGIKNMKREKRKNKYKIQWQQLTDSEEIATKKQPETEKKQSNDEKHIEEQAKRMNIDLDNHDKKSTSKKHKEVKKGILDSFYETHESTPKNDFKEGRWIPLMPYQHNQFVLAILELRNCTLLEDVKIETNILAENTLWENVTIDEGVWREGDCEILDGHIVYEKI
ncbi:hypothetical protein M153_950000320 [Pseudoloma neurophilia]|uniref:Uncharacterized protein n=1 Tax=Pseudoloma neurophilia TaxID=146866 RepID=A0A0R0LVU6_9MICR|nr:hypothetical protein M153_950000320 [Pseudoloma neurophilia]